MAAEPKAALALVTVPLMAERLMEEDLFQLLRGVVDVLNAHGVVANDLYETTLTITLHAKDGERTIFVLELEQAGVIREEK